MCPPPSVAVPRVPIAALAASQSDNARPCAVAALALLIAYGLYIRAVWGFWLTIVYLIYFGSVSYVLAGAAATQPYLGNLVWSVLVVIYLLFARKHFFGRKDEAAQLTKRPGT
jgi:hypothetical protein